MNKSCELYVSEKDTYCKYHHYHFRQNFCQLDFHISTSLSALKKPVRKEMKSSGDSQILHKIVSDTTQIIFCFSDFRVFSRIISHSRTRFFTFFSHSCTRCFTIFHSVILNTHKKHNCHDCEAQLNTKATAVRRNQGRKPRLRCSQTGPT